MAIDYSKFDQNVDLDALQKDVLNAKDSEFEDVPDGTYIVSIDKMEIKETKAGDKLMFSVAAKIKEGEFKGRLLFFNRVISGNTSPKWTDAQAIKSVISWVNKLLAPGEAPVEFVNYADFDGQILDVFQSVKDTIEIEMEWKAKNFNPMHFEEDNVYEV